MASWDSNVLGIPIAAGADVEAPRVRGGREVQVKLALVGPTGAGKRTMGTSSRVSPSREASRACADAMT